MSEEQIKIFRNNSYLNLALTLREFEDLSKRYNGDIKYTDLEYVKKLLNIYIK